MKIFKIIMNKIYKQFSVVLLTAGLLVGCTDDLEVTNPNQPDFARVYATANDVENIAGGTYNVIFKAEQSASGVHPMMQTAADNVTVSWGNFGFRDMSWEPRDFAWNNQPTYANQGQLKYTYDQLYLAAVTASNVLRALDNGLEIGANGEGNARVQAIAKFNLGLAYADLALLFDKAHVVDNNITVEESIDSAVPFDQVATAALGYLDEALAFTEGADFEIPGDWLGMGTDVSLTAGEFAQVINTVAARTLAYMPRNSEQLAEVDWARVQAYADAGIDFDWEIAMDGTTLWYMEAGDYETAGGWGRTDMYVVHMMAPTLPQHWDDSANFPHPAEPAEGDVLDKRLLSDFEYMSSNDFNPTRGYYHFTCYRSSRYDQVYSAAALPKPIIMEEENRMLMAEARAYQGELVEAADIINAGTRTTRGEMPDVAADLDEILDAIHHERHVEMYTTGMGLQFFEMRKRDLLQKGTPLHFPIPGQILQIFGLTEFYTFGRTANADGVNTSNGGWR